VQKQNFSPHCHR